MNSRQNGDDPVVPVALVPRRAWPCFPYSGQPVQGIVTVRLYPYARSSRYSLAEQVAVVGRAARRLRGTVAVIQRQLRTRADLHWLLTVLAVRRLLRHAVTQCKSADRSLRRLSLFQGGQPSHSICPSVSHNLKGTFWQSTSVAAQAVPLDPRLDPLDPAWL